MPSPPAGPASDFGRVFALFDRAMAVPARDREAFVAREAAGDAVLSARVLALLRADDVAKTVELRDAAAPVTGGDEVFERMRALLERALDVPEPEREAFVRREAAADPLLRGRAVDLSATILAVLHSAPAGPADGAPARGVPGDRVQSTATSALLARLEQAPRLDPNRYELHGEVDRGGMGAILRIHDRHLNRRLAMKVLLEREPPRDDYEQQLSHQLLGRFLEEAQITSQLDHPGVVPVHELGLDPTGRVYFTMRLVKGRTAHEVFAESHAGSDEWPLTRALEVLLKVCDTMAFAHDKGVLHRDLKPANVMVGRFGEVYVMDWGLAKVLGQPERRDVRIRPQRVRTVSQVDSARKRDADSDDLASVVSMDGQKIGTPCYMPPEQARSEPLDVRADVYAIGAMLYELLTGRAPYTSPGIPVDAYRILKEVNDGPPKRIEELQHGVPAELVAIADKAMARDKEQRYRSTVELATDLRAFLAHRAVGAYRTGALVELKLWVRRNKPLAASLAAAVLILCGGIVATTVYAREADRQAEANATLAQDEAAARQRFQGKVKEFDQLRLVVTYERLQRDEPTLGPGWPEQRAAIDRWVADAQRLLGQRDELAATVEAVRRDVPESGDGGTESAATFLAKALGDLLGDLPKLEALLPEMQKRQWWAQHVESLTRAHPNAKVTWAEARAAIAKADGVVASGLYAGQEIPLRDEDVWGLVPIGMNPQSKLWEFYDLRSAWDGNADPATLPIPQHGSDGRLTIAGETGIVFVLLPGGTLPAGSPVDERDEGAKRRLTVRLAPFFLGKYEVTQGQWRRWTGRNPSDSRSRNDLALPVEQVNWFDVDRELRGQGLMLPSELQWEYGVRGGTTTLWWTGDEEAGIRSAENFAPISGLRDAVLLPVGSTSPNPFGLVDMSGNVFEWCFDEESRYGTERPGDGRRPSPTVGMDGPERRMIRGGHYLNDPRIGQSAGRFGFTPTIRGCHLGLRAARTSRR